MKIYVPLLAAVLSMISTACLAQDLIIESRPEGKNHDKYKETAGKWLDSNTPANTAKSGAEGLTPQGQCGSRKTVISSPGTDPKAIIASAKFSPKFDAPGHYYVYVTFPKAANATPVNYVIKNAKGEQVKSISQDGWGAAGSPNAGLWLGLGDYDFSAGDDQYVELQVTGETGAASPSTGAQAFTDGLRFSPKAIVDSITASAAAAPQAVVAATPALIGSSKTSTAASAPAPAAANISLSWMEDLKSAQDAASRANKKIFVFFYSPETERSKNYDSKVFNDPKVKALLKEKFILVRVNIDENRTLANNLQVFRAGTINLYDEHGNGLLQITETLDAEDLADKLKPF